MVVFQWQQIFSFLPSLLLSLLFAVIDRAFHVPCGHSQGPRSVTWASAQPPQENMICIPFLPPPLDLKLKEEWKSPLNGYSLCHIQAPLQFILCRLSLSIFSQFPSTLSPLAPTPSQWLLLPLTLVFSSGLSDLLSLLGIFVSPTKHSHLGLEPSTRQASGACMWATWSLPPSVISLCPISQEDEQGLRFRNTFWVTSYNFI